MVGGGVDPTPPLVVGPIGARQRTDRDPPLLGIEPAGPDRADRRGTGLRQRRPARVDSEPGVFFFYENWDSADDLDAHLAAPHLVDFAARIPDLLDENGLTITRLKRLA